MLIEVIDCLPESSRTRNCDAIDVFPGGSVVGAASAEAYEDDCGITEGAALSGRIIWSTLFSILYCLVPKIAPLLRLCIVGLLGEAPPSSASSLIS